MWIQQITFAEVKEMNTIDELKTVIEETREELNKLVLTENYEKYYTVSLKMDAFIEEYLNLQAREVA